MGCLILVKAYTGQFLQLKRKHCGKGSGKIVRARAPVLEIVTSIYDYVTRKLPAPNLNNMVA